MKLLGEVICQHWIISMPMTLSYTFIPLARQIMPLMCLPSAWRLWGSEWRGREGNSTLARQNDWFLAPPGLCLTLDSLVHNLGVFLGSQLLLAEQVAAMPIGNFAQFHVMYQLRPISWTGRVWSRSLMPQPLFNWTTSMCFTRGCPWKILWSLNWSRIQQCVQYWVYWGSPRL